MNTLKKTVDFYMGANSPIGFCTYYDELCNPFCYNRSYLIKGGAGTGKSSLMKRVATECSENESIMELIHCSSDPNSLDGVILKDKGISIVDATPPHVIEPQYPGGFQTVINLCDYFNEAVLTDNLNKIIMLQTSNNECHKKCCRLLNCANILLDDNRTLVKKYTDFDKINVLGARLAKREFKKQQSKGIEHKRLLSAVTNQGIKTYYDTARTLCDRVYLIKDEYGVAGNELLQTIKMAALLYGYEIYCCYCPLNQTERIEHIFIPTLSLGFVTSNSFVRFDIDKLNPCSVISYTRFTDIALLKQRKQFLTFNKNVASKLIVSAVETLSVAKGIHDDLEAQYTLGVDFKAVTKKADAVIKKINQD